MVDPLRLLHLLAVDDAHPAEHEHVESAAVTTRSASICSSVVRRSPAWVNVASWPVTTEAVPARSARNRSPSGDPRNRWSPGSYGGGEVPSHVEPGLLPGQLLGPAAPPGCG